MFKTGQVKTSTRSFSLPARAKALALILTEEFGVPFRFYDAALGQELPVPDAPPPPAPDKLSPEDVLRFAEQGKCRVTCRGEGVFHLAVVLFDAAQPLLVAEAQLQGLGGPTWVQEQDRLQRWLQAVSDRIRLSEQAAALRHAEREQEAQVKRAWGVVLGIDETLRHFKFHKEAGGSRLGLLRTVQGLLDCETVAWVPVGGDGSTVLHGAPVLSAADCSYLVKLLLQAGEPRAGRPTLWNRELAGAWSARLPGLHNVLAVPLNDGPRTAWLVALNKTSGGPVAADRKPASVSFRRADAAALMPFASLLDLQGRGQRRFQDLKDLLVGLTRSLTAAIDAKDTYTFGHSERVARVGVELGREMGLPEDELSDIYLAGLLHDIGKIGIRDAVLGKAGPLTAEEFEHIKEHPMIGYRILADLAPLRGLLPGVRNHHERYDGKGYPDGLAGEDIPLLARILAVADCFDAMSTKRPYRDALSRDEVERRMREGAGTQWDRCVIEAFVLCRDRVHLIRQRGVGESLNQALEGVMRGSGDSAHHISLSL